MWVPLIFVLLMLPASECGILRSILGGIIPGLGIDHVAIESLRRVKSESASFSMAILPFSELYGKTFNDGVQRISRNLLGVTNEMNHRNTNLEHSYYVQIEENYEKKIYKPLKDILDKIDFLQQGEPTRNEIKEFLKECDTVPQIAESIDTFKGWKCMNATFSHKTASIIFKYIDHFKFENYFLSEEEESLYNARYAVLYFYLFERKNITIYDFGEFINPRQVILYKNKIQPLEELIAYLGINKDTVTMSECIPLTSFMLHHFNTTALLEERDTIIKHISTLNQVSQLCGNLSQSDDPVGAQKLISTVEEKTSFIKPIISEWFISLMNSTWDETETDLMRGFMKEAAQGRPIPENSAEYVKIAKYVHHKMKSLCDSRFWRQYVVHKDPKDPRSYDFEHHCKWNTCSHTTSMGAQCIVLKTPKDGIPVESRLQNLAVYTGNITEMVILAMSRRFWFQQRLPEVIWKMTMDYGIDWEGYDAHSSLIGMKTSRFRRDCQIPVGIQSDEELGTRGVQRLHYHNDGNIHVDCFDWVFLLGV